MTDQPPVAYAVADGVARIELNRPAASNAVDLDTARALRELVDRAGADEQVRAILLTGAGKRFCAGGDVASMKAATDPRAYVEELALTLDAGLQALAALPKPVVAGVQGAVAGAGLAVMLSCDVVVAAESTRFVSAYAGVGLTPDCGVSWLLPRAVGQQRALDLLLTGRVLGAVEALSWGMVTEVVGDEALSERAGELAGRLASGPVFAYGQARLLVRGSFESTRAAVGTEEARVIGHAVTTADAVRLLGAFGSR